ncbi:MULTISPECIES: fimbrial protein [Enterobacteriaceae]|uniref:Fimbrial protein n=1 Tax=Raoultella lignicola TaxID=3040939 RepID=A0ABU9FAR0_9ENTR|nr:MULTISPECIES: fimbrial protein [Enterobacteriaceae]MRT49114.1 type 1 fimbrial protein [Raoultella sp. RIT712]QNK07571.1 type 1 fimbrial protein [Enterobacter sp. JUb54]ROS10822.1 minor pilin subunit PapK [Raoultella sp. BIGb0399]
MRRLFFSLVLQVMGMLLVVGDGRADVVFNGNLLDRPCHVDTASLTQDVTFREAAAPLFWIWPAKGYEEPLRIGLVNCYASSLGKVVRLTFRGPGETDLPGYLAVSGVNAGRLGIGILDTDGRSLLKLGDAHHQGAGDVVTGKTLMLNFRVFTQATPAAIAQKSVVPGDYSAMVTFELNYQ